MRELGSTRQLILLAPPRAPIPEQYRCVEQNDNFHAQLLRQLRALRGRIMVEESVIAEHHLDESGCHKAPIDLESWHLLIIHNGRVSGCARYLVHPSNVLLSQLDVQRTATFECKDWANRVSSALQRELAIARRQAFSLIEFGGWVLTKELRGTSEAVRMALASYAFCQIAGGCFGLTTATVQHGSSSILRRIGGRSLLHNGKEILRYYDPEYNCEMEMLRFDSRELNPRYIPLLEGVRASLLSTPIICCSVPGSSPLCEGEARLEPSASSGTSA